MDNTQTASVRGLRLMIDGKIVGAIGVSGVNADQDGMVAKAGADVTTQSAVH